MPSGSPASGCSGETEAGSGGAGIRTPPRDVRGVARLLSPCSAARCPGGARCDTLNLPEVVSAVLQPGALSLSPGPEGPITSGLRASTGLGALPSPPHDNLLEPSGAPDRCGVPGGSARLATPHRMVPQKSEVFTHLSSFYLLLKTCQRFIRSPYLKGITSNLFPKPEF